MKGYSSGSSAENTPEASKAPGTPGFVPFVLKLPAPKFKRGKNKKSPQAITQEENTRVHSEVLRPEPKTTVSDRMSEEVEVKESFWGDNFTTKKTRAKSEVSRDYESGSQEANHNAPLSGRERLNLDASILHSLESERRVEATVRSFEKLSFKESSRQLH